MASLGIPQRPVVLVPLEQPKAPAWLGAISDLSLKPLQRGREGGRESGWMDGVRDGWMDGRQMEGIQQPE